MKIYPLRADLEKYLEMHALAKKWNKTKLLFEKDMRYPSLHTELLRPFWRGIYSFRIDKKYHALFFTREGSAEIFQITNHYKK
jgi:plasmid maintenance system killer protein